MRILACLMAFGLIACASDQGRTPEWTTVDSAAVEKAAGVDHNTTLARVLEDHWELVLKEDPVFATRVGDDRYSDRLPDLSLASYEAGLDARRALLSRLRQINSRDLTENERLNRELLIFRLRDELAASQHNAKYLLLTDRSGPHLTLTALPRQLSFLQAEDFANYVKRLEAIPTYLEQATDLLRQGVEAGWTLPCTPMMGYEDSINTHIVINPKDSVFIQPFKIRPTTIDEERFALLRMQAEKAVLEAVVPAFRDFEAFYNLEYQPYCRENVGIDDVPGGKAYYDYLVKHFTTTDISADEVHEIGLREVERIRAEMTTIAEGEGYETLAEFQNYLRTDPKFYPKSSFERMKEVALIAKKMDGQLVNLFSILPRMPYDIQEIPLDIAEKTTTAYYTPPSADGTLAGTYWVNTSKLHTRPLYELEALSLHEAVPGHHFQIALAQELDLPEFRRHSFTTAFVEGWGLYSERLGLEVGFYQTPYTDFGRLSYEMWRAVRLVVDTGMHSRGWNRQRSIDFMLDNTGLSQNNATTEIDRYITWPGQALAYKIGELKIRELREKAETELGEDFDLRRFHDELLAAGAIPLAVMEERMNRWIEDEKKS